MKTTKADEENNKKERSRAREAECTMCISNVTHDSIKFNDFS
jgi:hypothetical protein